MQRLRISRAERMCFAQLPRERFGHRPGEFPVTEDVAARSIALPFFPQLREEQIERVARSLAVVLGQA